MKAASMAKISNGINNNEMKMKVMASNINQYKIEIQYNQYRNGVRNI